MSQFMYSLHTMRPVTWMRWGKICHCQCCAKSFGSQCNQQMNFFCINHRRKCNCFRLSLSPIGRSCVVEGVGHILLSHVHIYFHCDYTFSSSSSSSSLCSSCYLANRLQFDTLPSMQDTPPTRRMIVKSKVFLKPDFSIARFRMVHVDMPILMRLLCLFAPAYNGPERQDFQRN